MRALFLLLVLLLTPLSLAAQQRPNTILVMDGSGSMWGQIDGVNKIVIAREVVSDVLGDFPADQNLGLTVYGHRTRGDCTDIETVIAPATGTAGQIVEVVNGLNPRGSTPMTDAIIAAAEALRFTEEKATVVLVSDGIETCNPDPCSAMRALEEAGIDFTAHVIGFDVGSDPEALAQMQCIAEETGGTFTTAANASELTEALAVVVEPEPVSVTGTFTARFDTGETIADPVFWTVTSADGTTLTDEGAGNPFTLPGMAEGSYNVEAFWTVGEMSRETSVSVTGPGDVTAAVVFPAPPQMTDVTFTARIGSADGPVITDPVLWEITPAGDGTEIDPANPATVSLERGAYTVTGYWTVAETEQSQDFVLVDEPREIVLVFEEPLPQATVVAPASAPMGATVEVGWTGPAEDNDYIAVSRPDEDGYVNFTYVQEGNPLDLLMPSEPGSYEVRYHRRDGRVVLASSPIEVTPVTAQLVLRPEAMAGETIQVGWDGPDYDNDYIGVSIPGEDGYINFTYTGEGNPVDLLMPPDPGEYEVRYFMRQDRVVLATAPVSVSVVKAEITAPEQATAGSTIEVGWTGPDYDNDYIGVSIPGEDGYINFTYTREGSPLDLLMPTEPGTYELRYFLRQDRSVLAVRSIEVVEVGAQLTAPEQATAGETIEVGWTGPDYDNDYIGVSIPGEDGYVNFSYTQSGNPLDLVMPTEPGSYELRYFLRQDRSVLASRPIEVVAVGADLVAPESSTAGSTIQVGWTGPDYDNDYIGVSIPGEDGYVNFSYTRSGNPLDLVMPTEPGSYELRYFLRQDRSVLASRPIEVVAVGADLVAPTEAVAGETIQVGWTGPDYDNDYIGVSIPGDGGYVEFTYTSAGNPLNLLMPSEPGSYELRYFLRQDRSVLATAPITVNPVKAELTAPERAAIGERVQVDWTGPDYDNDYIGVSVPGEDGYETFTYTREGNPLEIVMPPEPGSYELRYFMRQDRKVLAVRAIEVDDVAVTLVAPDSGPAGGTLLVGHDGPDYDRDYIGVAVPGSDGYETYRYTREGNPLEVPLPDAPGTYELRYFMDASPDTVLGTRTITVE
ncbi:VWA domain-containing protein [Histidinibacterium lentulum]|uniref:VWA domain-containing protein n=1 Tax=Histidinibacterium lentulum TaxID=2480588 RepID=A0A3N2R9P2_9RHOB|nr:VWA domain-containing protein [Histidinibacterium lentulum]ROU04145.1 VWA domain-containing protein [Histidinibacterium lentulum]